MVTSRACDLNGAQGELLGRLDLTVAQAHITRWELADAKTQIEALEEEVQNERETSGAARRRAEAVERQLIAKEREVRIRSLSFLANASYC